MKTVLIAALAVNCSLSAKAGVFVFDSFTNGTTAISSVGPLVSDYDVGLVDVIGGTRYSYAERTSAGGTTSLGINTFPFIGMSFFTSSATAVGVGGLSYGQFAPLNLDWSNEILSYGMELVNFAADAEGEAGTIRLTMYTSGGNASVAYNIGAFEQNSRWLFSDFAGIDRSNVTRIDIDWYGFGSGGADIEFSMIGISHNIPELGTMAMLGVASLILYSVRKKQVLA